MTDICDLTHQACSDANNDVKKEADKHLHCLYESKFDLFKTQFILMKEFLSGFVIYDYENDLKIHTLGTMFTSLAPKSRFLLANSQILSSHTDESKIIPTSMEALYESSALNMDIVLIDLESKSSQTLATFGKSTQFNSNLLLNEAHRAITYNSKEWSTWPALNAITSKVVTLKVDKAAFVKLDFNMQPCKIGEAEAEAMHVKQLKKEEGLKIAEERKRKKKAKAEAMKANKDQMVAKYLNNPELTVEGPIHNWKVTYGFMKAKGEAKALGNLFVHMSKMTNAPSDRKVIRNGQWIECKVSKDDEHANFMAIEIKLKERPEAFNTTVSQAQPQVSKRGHYRGGRGHYRGRGSRGRGRGRGQK